jgi:hypothetical protein
MPAFIEQDGDPQLPPPYLFPGITITSFRLNANMAALRQLCDRLLNIGTLQQRGFEFRPLIPYVDMEIVNYPRMEGGAPPYSGKGYMSQNEIYFRFFVIKYVYIAGVLVPTADVGCFFPLIFVDNSWSVIAGREVLGFPKNLAKFDLPKSGPYPIEVSTQVFPQYTPYTPLEWKPFVTVRAGTASGSGLPPGPWPWGQILALNPVLQALLDASGIFQQSLLSTIQFKQFRDAQTATDACYQALTQSTFTATNIQNPRPLPPATITLGSDASLPISSLLGFSGISLTPLWQYSLQCDMTFGNTRNIFVAR